MTAVFILFEVRFKMLWLGDKCCTSFYSKMLVLVARLCNGNYLCALSRCKEIEKNMNFNFLWCWQKCFEIKLMKNLIVRTLFVSLCMQKIKLFKLWIIQKNFNYHTFGKIINWVFSGNHQNFFYSITKCNLQHSLIEHKLI